jgi:hypothetical protein
VRRPTALAAACATALVAVPSAHAAVHATEVATFSGPVFATAPPADPHRLMVVEQGGRVRVVRDGVKLRDPFLDITADVKSGGEQGLLSIAFPPDYAASRKLYAYYTAASPRAGDGGSDIVVDEFTARDDDHAVRASRRRLVTIPHPVNTNHNGGTLQFGPDGRLYAGTGDGGSGDDPDGNAQDRGSRLGKLLVIDRDSGGAQIYASGLRNPFRFSFDRATGDLELGDVGQNRAEEIDYAPAGTGAGVDYGWRCYEGFRRTSNSCNSLTGFTEPVIEQDRSTGFCAIIGGYVVRDPGLTDLRGRYLYGDNCQAQMRSLRLALPRATDDRPVPGLSIPSTSGFGEDSCGHVYVTSLEGPLYRLDGDGVPTPCSEGGGADTTAPTVRLTRTRAQRAVKQRGFVVAVRCGEACGFTATGKLRIGGAKGSLALKKFTRLAAPGQRVKVNVALTSRALRRLRTGLARGERARATLTVVARDAAGNESSRQIAVTAKR